MNATVKEVYNDCVEIAWEPAEGAEKYHVYWADKDISTLWAIQKSAALS